MTGKLVSCTLHENGDHVYLVTVACLLTDRVLSKQQKTERSGHQRPFGLGANIRLTECGG